MKLIIIKSKLIFFFFFWEENNYTFQYPIIDESLLKKYFNFQIKQEWLSYAFNFLLNLTENSNYLDLFFF